MQQHVQQQPYMFDFAAPLEQEEEKQQQQQRQEPQPHGGDSEYSNVPGLGQQCDDDAICDWDEVCHHEQVCAQLFSKQYEHPNSQQPQQRRNPHVLQIGDHTQQQQQQQQVRQANHPPAEQERKQQQQSVPHQQQQQQEQPHSTPPTSTPNCPLFFARFRAGWVYASLGTVAVSLLEKQRRYEEAVDLLQLLLGGNACLARRGAWWTRLSINLEHLKNVDAALEVAEAALADPYVRHGDRLALQRRVLRLGKPPRRWKRPSWAAAALAEPAERRITGRPLEGSIGSRNRWGGVCAWWSVCAPATSKANAPAKTG